jgi:TPR repeat protein
MKKLLMVLLLFTALVHADLINNGLKAFNNGNYKEAKKLWKKAADQGYAEAQFILGLMYYDGQGVRQDYKEALKWCRKAADQGNAGAQFILGLMYDIGQGVRQNKSKAKELFGQACDNGYQEGCHNYKILNEQGIR